ncbi:hypothetical protein KGY73_06190 [bacterium]|nr:hypothetical protein [bacterium]
MKVKFSLFFLILLGLCSLMWSQSSSILPLDQVEEGMKGKGKSVFGKNQFKEFDVEILGVLRNVQPKKNIILAKLKSDILEETGMISGMSGSPVYIDGKLIGAIAYSFPYAQEAIAGITPISEMLSIFQEKSEERTSFTPRVPVQKYLSLEKLYEINKGFFQSKTAHHIDGQTFKPLNIPLMFSGFSPGVFKKAKSFFSSMGFTPVRASPSGQSLEDFSPSDISLREGDPVGVQFVSGDLNVSAVGTATYVHEGKVLAFGHPMYNLGPVNYAMTKAEVITVVPSVSSSFKLASTGKLVGSFSQDRHSGIYGELKKMPDFIPLNVEMMSGKTEKMDFKMEVVEDKILTPSFVNLVLQNILISQERSIGDLSLAVSGQIYLENGRNVQVEDLFSGQYDTSVTNLSNLFASVVYFLVNNGFKDLSIHRIDVKLRAFEQVKFSYLEKVWVDKYEVSPGERMSLKIFTRDFRGDLSEREVGLRAPHLPAGSQFYLVVADAQSLQKLEASQYKSPSFMPRNLTQLIRILSHLRKNNRIYLKMIASKPGLFLKGEEMPNLPPTMKSMFSSPRAASSSPTDISQSTLGNYQLRVPNVFQGMAMIPIQIKK